MRSVANLTRDDARAFFALLPTLALRPHVQAFALAQANEALEALRAGTLEGSAVLLPAS